MKRYIHLSLVVATLVVALPTAASAACLGPQTPQKIAGLPLQV